MAITEVYLGLGGNLGDRAGNLRRGAAQLAERMGETEVSSIYRTTPVGLAIQPEYYNMVVRVWTRLTVFELMHVIRMIETDAGRTRKILNGPRTLDIDILLFGPMVLNSPSVIVPHPRLIERYFVLEPLAELAPSLRHPVLRQTFTELLSRLCPGTQAESVGRPPSVSL
ncbi:2-amino-4-hydroxy-6-hydroxymethyldihydropteridine diphosphokinase [Dehalococcoidia bacterium]|nr:2-amino-4-hydroxy-6-hydroxymethyldihydropteridine diphosphokinase [Dehalococcoidia bacterium]